MKKHRFFLAVSLLTCVICSPLYASVIEDPLIEGLVIEKVERGKKIYSIEAGKAKFANKRMGFFEIGTSKLILMEEAYLTLYQDGKLLKRQYLKYAEYDINSQSLLDEKGNVVYNFAVPASNHKFKNSQDQ